MGSFKLCSNTKKNLSLLHFLGSFFYQNILARSMCFCELKNKVVSGFTRKTYLLPEFLHGCSTKKLKKILYKLKSADCKIHIRKLKLTLFVRVQIISYFGHPGEINSMIQQRAPGRQSKGSVLQYLLHARKNWQVCIISVSYDYITDIRLRTRHKLDFDI